MIVDLLYPQRCPICDTLIDFDNRIILKKPQEGRGIHKKCQKLLFPVTGVVCLKCGQPIDGEREEYCFDCQKKQHNFSQGKSLFLYKGNIKGTMYRFKYGDKREYANFFASEAAMQYKKWMQDCQIDVILPVPMYKRKQKERGYNQADTFAMALSKACGIPCRKDLVKRVKSTLPQKNLNDSARKNNLKNAFLVSENIVIYNYILIVDDIYTTGSTIDAIASELQKYGKKHIYFLSICIGKGL